MARRVRPVAPELARAYIARTVLGHRGSDVKVGCITLHEHQRDAVTRVRAMIARHGGAVLADEVGVGKTFVALAIARAYASTLVVAPSVLRATWLDAARATAREISFHSIEALSRGALPVASADFVIVDEAHHFRNPSTRRYSALAQIVARKPVLLLTATPVHNRRGDLTALLRLFSDDDGDPAELDRYVVRREHSDLGAAIRLPDIADPISVEIAAPAGVVRAVRSLPPPVATREGSIARTLVATSLLHQLASSVAAFRNAVRRRIAAGEAMIECLERGSLPSAAELGAWTRVGDDVQLALPELVVACDAAPPAGLLAAIRAHTHASRALLGLGNGDDEPRVRHLTGILAAHGDAIVVAFAQYRATVDALYASLRHMPGVAAITGRGARIASGPIPRDELLSMVRLDAAPARRVRLLLATDLLSEGVNLTDTSVVVHLDLPWTAARMEQRTGRCRRLGSRHVRVVHYIFTPGVELDGALRASRLLLRKAAVARRAIGAVAMGSRAERSDVRFAELVRAELANWLRDDGEIEQQWIWTAAVQAPRAGYLALVSCGGDALLVTPRGASPRAVHRCLGDCTGTPAMFSRADYLRARRAVERWMRHRETRANLGIRKLSRARAAELGRAGTLIGGVAIHSRRRAAAALAAERGPRRTGDPGLRLRALLLLMPPIDTAGTREQCGRARAPDR